MTLEFERLTPELQQMAAAAARLRAFQQERAALLRDVLDKRATDWDAIEAGLIRAQGKEGADPKYFRAARPLTRDEPLDVPIAPPPPPTEATLIATDGSQILPDRHAPYLYYLINIGAIVYRHGRPVAPSIISRPSLFYPDLVDDQTDDEPGFDKSVVTIERDRREIETLASLADAARGGPTLTLALLDQRLLYWPFIGERDADVAVRDWTAAMIHIYETGALLAGYIDRPGKSSVVTMLQTLLDRRDIDLRQLGRRPAGGELNDADLYATLLGPGQRSPVFLDVSPANRRFAETHPEIEVCFFYLNPGTGSQGLMTREDGSSLVTTPPPLVPSLARAIARVDIPRWVADDPAAVAFVHSLIYDQCRLLGDYPYVLARADELAVVGRHDETNLNLMIEQAMQRLGVPDRLLAAKQNSKDIARGGSSRYEFGPRV